MDLQQDVLPQPETEMGVDVVWTLSDPECPIGQAIDGPSITCVVAFEDEVLDDEVSVAFQYRTRWQIAGLQDMILIDAEVFGFVAFHGAWTFARRLCWRRLGWPE